MLGEALSEGIQGLLGQRLYEMPIEARAYRFDEILIGISYGHRDKKDPSITRDLSQALRELEAIHDRHREIAQNGIRRPPLDLRQCGHPVGGEHHARAQDFQKQTEHLAHFLVIVDHEDGVPAKHLAASSHPRQV